MLISTTMINRDEKHSFGPDPEELEEIEASSMGELFQKMRALHGRCTGKVHIDTRGPSDPPGVFNKTLTIGWVFLKKDKYEDTGEPFLCETWITVHEQRPTITHHYADV